MATAEEVLAALTQLREENRALNERLAAQEAQRVEVAAVTAALKGLPDAVKAAVKD